MKLRIFFCSLSVFFSGTILKAQTDSTGMPGDNLDLYAVMDLFKKSSNLEDFEKSLNSSDNNINNLDLNGDGETDYIKVIDNSEKDAHAIVLQVDINEKESQDVAVIELEKEGLEDAKIQIVGDDDVYGKDYVVEPYESYVSKDEYDAQYTEQTRVEKRVVVNVWTWPAVTYVYGPVYRPWRSPWYWRHYPGWWRPCRPHPWHVYHSHVWHYHGHGYYYRHVNHYHARSARNVYHGNRTYSHTYRKSANIDSRGSRYHGNRHHDTNARYNNGGGRYKDNAYRNSNRGGDRMNRQHNNGNRGDRMNGNRNNGHRDGDRMNRQQNNGNRHGDRMNRQQNNGNGRVSPGNNRSRNHGGGTSNPQGGGRVKRN